MKNSQPKKTTMYAIVFDLDQAKLKEVHPDTWHTDAYRKVAKVLKSHGFTSVQGSVYFGDMDKVDAVSCMIAAMDVVEANPWFAEAVTDIRMLRIEDNNDLMPLVQRVSKKTSG